MYFEALHQIYNILFKLEVKGTLAFYLVLTLKSAL